MYTIAGTVWKSGNSKVITIDQNIPIQIGERIIANIQTQNEKNKLQRNDEKPHTKKIPK